MVDDDVLDPDQTRRMRGLYETQDERLLTDDEWVELDGLIAAYGHRLHERRMRELAAELAAALGWWQEVQSDPARLEALIADARARRDASAITSRSVE